MKLNRKSKYYWKKIRLICDKYDVHLILDEVWCGTGTTGKIYCCDWDEVSPDFLFSGDGLGFVRHSFKIFCNDFIIAGKNNGEDVSLSVSNPIIMDSLN